jgi:hypothetical protein
MIAPDEMLKKAADACNEVFNGEGAPAIAYAVVGINPETGEMYYTSNAKREVMVNVFDAFVQSNKAYLNKEKLNKLKKERR